MQIPLVVVTSEWSAVTEEHVRGVGATLDQAVRARGVARAILAQVVSETWRESAQDSSTRGEGDLQSLAKTKPTVFMERFEQLTALGMSGSLWLCESKDLAG